jgi:hypothetical protein
VVNGATTNYPHPVVLRSAEITMQGLDITGYANKDRTGLTPIFDVNPSWNHVLDGEHWIITGNGTRVR